MHWPPLERCNGMQKGSGEMGKMRDWYHTYAYGEWKHQEGGTRRNDKTRRAHWSVLMLAPHGKSENGTYSLGI